MQYLIRHIIIELHHCQTAIIDDVEQMDALLHAVAHAIQTDIIGGTSHRFQPQGVTAMLIVGASHLSVHTWPEHRYASVDLVVCTDGFNLPEVVALVKARTGAGDANFIEFRRGLIEPQT